MLAKVEDGVFVLGALLTEVGLFVGMWFPWDRTVDLKFAHVSSLVILRHTAKIF